MLKNAYSQTKILFAFAANEKSTFKKSVSCKEIFPH